MKKENEKLFIQWADDLINLFQENNKEYDAEDIFMKAIKKNDKTLFALLLFTILSDEERKLNGKDK